METPKSRRVCTLSGTPFSCSKSS